MKSPSDVISAPAGTVPDRLNVSVSAGRSLSVASAVNDNNASSSTFCDPIPVKIGASFTGLIAISTVTVLPLSIPSLT